MRTDYQIVGGKVVECPVGEGGILLFINPAEEERRYLIDTLNVDDHTLASALDPDEQARLEFEDDHIAIIFKRPKNYSHEDEIVFKVLSTGAFLFKDKLVVVIADDAPMFDGAKSFIRLESLAGVLLKLVYRTIFHFLGHLKGVTAISDEIEDKIQTSQENRYLMGLFALEKSLVYYLNAIHSNQMVLEKLRNAAARIGFTQEELALLDDILIENNQCLKQAEIHSNILAGLMDARASIISNNLNVLMKTLNIVTISIMVPTLVVSIFSMNVPLPLQESPWGFVSVVSLSFAAGIIFLLYWRSRKW